jgi:hypothetical protein
MEENPTLQEIPILEIELDKGNPRIAKYLQMYGDEITPEQIALALGAGDSSLESSGFTTFRSLRESIKTNRGIINPILVNKLPDGKLRVIEGNTRVAIYKDFKMKGISGNWDTIPAMVYESMTEKEINAIRLQAHLVGPRPWDPYSKAMYLNYLRNSEHLTYNQIVDYCGGREKEVADYIEAYEMMESYYRPLLESDDQFDPTRFSAFVELQRPRVQDAIRKSGCTFTDFSKWIIDHKIDPLNTIRQLPIVLDNPKSREIFLKGGRRSIQEALKALEVPAPDAILRNASISQLAQALFDRILNLPYGDLKLFKANKDSSEVQILFEAKDQLIDLCNDIDLEQI